jgi:hypothetical protein
MGLAVDRATAVAGDTDGEVGYVYVLKIGTAANLWKIGKAKNQSERLKAHRTMSTERLLPYVEIASVHYSDLETFVTHRLQGRRWLSGEGSEIYEADRSVIDEAVAAAQQWEAIVLPRMRQAAELAGQSCDGTALTPDEAVMELHRERLRWKQAEWIAKQEGERIDAELKLIIGVASELLGVATWRSGVATDFDEARFRCEHEELYEAYRITKPIRPFKIRW